MKTAKKIKLFVQQFVAVVKGDDSKALGIKTLREADATLTAQIAVLKGKNVQLENVVEATEELLDIVMVNNGQPIGGRGDDYIANLFNRENDITLAKEKLTQNHERIAFLEKTLTKLNSEVDEEV